MKTFFEECREAAEGKISCKCGNTDWKEFLYVGSVKVSSLIAGCKQCGRQLKTADAENWTIISDKTFADIIKEQKEGR